jgi:hypothetical protein
MPRGVRSFQQSAALTFGAATSDRVNCGVCDAATGDTMTTIGWVYPTTLANLKVPFSKEIAATNDGWITQFRGTTEFRLFSNNDTLANGNCVYETTDAGLVVNTWYCLAVQINNAGGAGDRMRLFVGDLVRPMRRCAVTVGTDKSNGFTSLATASLGLGNKTKGSPTSAISGRLGAAAYFGTRLLTLPELQAWKVSALDEPFPAVMSGCVGLWYPGKEGAGVVLDHSGYHNTGTVTGATLGLGLALPALRFRPRAPYRVPDGFTWANDDGWMTSGMVEPSATALWGG